MSDPLSYFKGMSSQEFYSDLKARHSEYSIFAEAINEMIWQREQDELVGIPMTQNYSEYNSYLKVDKNRNYIEECYDIREKRALSSIKKKIYDDLDKEKTEEFVRLIVNELSQLYKRIQEIKLDEELLPYKDKVEAKLQKFILFLKETYLGNLVSLSENTPKVQWLGNIKILTTLIYELWKGQEKGKELMTKQLIKAQKKDLESLLLNNFIDSKNKPLVPSTISDYLNESKPETRAKKEIRIELDY